MLCFYNFREMTVSA